MQQQQQNQKAPVIDSTSPVVGVYCETEFNQLTETEKKYSYYFSQACWEGSKICYFQKSYESPALFIILQLVYSGQTIQELTQTALGNGIIESDIKKILVYSATVFNNCGNFKSFGDSKFIPEVSEQTFYKFITLSRNYQGYRQLIDEIYNDIKDLIFNYQGKFAKIGFPEDGQTGYYSSNMTRDDIKLADEFLQIVNIDTLNTRVIKQNNQHYQILVGSANLKNQTNYHKDVRFDVIYGDFSAFLRRLSKNLQDALKYAANHNQKQMIKKYVEHFNGGDIEVHKDSQRAWVKDQGPVIETNIGFIETYLDPKNCRAEFEGFVALVDKEQSKKTQNFVNQANKFIAMMPWPKEYDKDSFLKPDFTQLAVLTFGSSGIPLGINIPNYDEIRQDEGFKNVFLGNCVPSPKIENILYLNQADAQIYCTRFAQVVFHKVIYHELLGHGCGKLFQKTENGYNFDLNTIDPLTGQPILSYYKELDTWRSIFQSLSSSYEECRADSVALYFSNFKESYLALQPEVVDHWEEICYASYIEFIYQGIQGLQYYDAENKKWGQAHIHGRWVILQVLLEAGKNFINIQKIQNQDGKNWIKVDFDRSQAMTTGKVAMEKFLLKLQVFKSTADFARGSEMFNHYSQVNDKFLEIRQIVIDNKKPRKLDVQCFLELNQQTQQIKYVKFPESFEGVIESYIRYFPHFDVEMYNLWKEFQVNFKPSL